ncbi:LamG domain-containing protein [Phytohabitans rumicis]|nr:LamG domain-containing protein [Phytohabitans rumicis]
MVALPTSFAAAPVQNCVDTAASESDAVAVARRCDRAVEVSSLASETVKVVANPDGRLVLEQYVVPVRVRRGPEWVKVDTDLTVHDGRPVPKAAAVDVRFSRGGTDPLATVMAAGGSVSMSWAGPLPAPVINGDTAVYPEVLPGVDLRVRATATGFTQVLVVKNAAAAANKKLRAIRYGWASDGLAVASRADGGIDVKDATGRVVLSGAPGSMWDSSSGVTARGLAAASTAELAGDRARQAPVRLTLSSGALTVTPDAGMLTDPATVFPLFIDPPLDAVRNRWGYANDGGNNRNDGIARVGKNPDGSGAYRSYFEFDVSPFAGKNVYDTRFYIHAVHTSPCDPTPVSLWVTDNIDAGVNGTRTTWAPPMSAGNWADEKSVEANADCGDQSPVSVEFGHYLFYHVRWRADRSIPTMTVALATYNQSGYGEGVDYWKKFNPTTAKLTVKYNTAPDVPAFVPHPTTTDCFQVCGSATTASSSTTQGQGWWKLNETSGTVAADAASPPHPATIAGTVRWGDGGAVFDGGGDLYTTGPVLDTTKSFTISAWAKLTDNSVWRSVLNQDANSAAGFTLQYDKGVDRWSFILFHSDTDGTTSTYANSAATPTLNAWTHLVGVFDLGRKHMRLYVNGVLEHQVFRDSNIASNGVLTIGRSKHASQVKNYFLGGIDNVQVYQRAITTADVSALYADGRGGGALNISPAVVRTVTPTLSARVLDPEPDAQVSTGFEVRTAPSETATQVHWTNELGPHASGTTVTTLVPAGKLSPGSTYYWRAYSKDEEPWNSDWSPFYALRVDTSAPAPGTPPITSPQYPERQWGPRVGDPGTFTFSSTGTDAIQFEWWVDNGTHTTVPATGSGPVTAQVTWTPSTDMVHTMQVRAKDQAGNVSNTATYQFWVTPSPNIYSHWTLDEASGGTAADSGNAPTNGGALSPLTLSGAGVAFAPGGVADPAGTPTNSLLFSGDGAAAAARPVLDTTKAFTAMAWVKPTDLTTDRTVLSQDGAAASRFQLHFDRQANAGNGGWCASMRAADGSAPTTVCTTGASVGLPSTTDWVHLAVVYQPALASQQLRVYVMGDPRSCAPSETAAITFTGTWSATGAFVVGRAKAAGPRASTGAAASTTCGRSSARCPAPRSARRPSRDGLIEIENGGTDNAIDKVGAPDGVARGGGTERDPAR